MFLHMCSRRRTGTVSPAEVNYLMKLMLWIFRHELDNFMKHGIRLRLMGSKLRLGKALVRAIIEAEERTKLNDKGTLLLCLNYGGQQEIVDAMKQIVAAGTPASEITADLIEQHLYAPGIPPVDLIIRTSGEQRLSNFMLWEGAYSELMFTGHLLAGLQFRRTSANAGTVRRQTAPARKITGGRVIAILVCNIHKGGGT
jgi:undecaprenyl diphosphate synthase